MNRFQPIRRGSTLLELLVVVTATAAILAAVIVLLHFTFRMNDDARKRAHAVTSIGCLAEQFRSDIHAADRAPVLAGDGRSLEANCGDTTINWRIEPARVVRGETKKAAAARESSFACEAAAGKFEIESRGTAKIVSLRLDSTNEGPSLSIDAAALLDRHLAGEEKR